MRRTIIIIAAIAAAGLLAGCGNLQSLQPGNAVAVSAVTTVQPTVTSQPAVTVQLPVTTVVQPPTVVVQAPSTVVVRPPSTVVQAPSSGNTADQQVANDRSSADSILDNWIPQMGSYTDSPSAMHRFDDLQQAGYSPFMIWSGDYSSFASSNYFVIMLPRPFASAAAVNAWLDGQGIEANLGFAKFLSHTHGSSGSTVER